MIRKSVIACTALALLLAGCGQQAQPKGSEASQNETPQEVQAFANVQEFLETLELTDVVTITDEEDCTVVLGTMDEAGQEQMDAYWRQVLNTDSAATLHDATIPSTLEFTKSGVKPLASAMGI